MSITFPDEAKCICVDICKLNTQIGVHCYELRQILLRFNIINENTTYEELMSTVGFVDALESYLALGLSDQISTSTKGCKIVSDWDLYHNLDKPKKIKLRMIELKVTDMIVLDQLKNNRRSLKRTIQNLCIKVIEEMGFVALPTIEVTPTKSKKEAEKEVEEQFTALSIAKSNAGNYIYIGLPY
jgi:hypothetical protein